MSRRISFTHWMMAAVLLLVVLIACIWLWTPAPRYASWAWRRVAGGVTVEQRLEQFGPAARARLHPHFEKAGIAYPPQAITFIALKDLRQLEVWVDRCDHAHANNEPCNQPPAYIRSYPILAASGKAGPKLREGDRQVPEGLYEIESLNPNSMFHLALRVNYPSEVDRAQAKRDGRDNLGGDIMIHGSDASVGCLAMGDPAIEELFVLAAETGIEHIQLIIAPMDFRENARAIKPIVIDDQPQWVSTRYEEISQAMQPYARTLDDAVSTDD